MDIKIINNFLIVRSASDDMYVWRLKGIEDDWQQLTDGHKINNEKDLSK